MTTPRDTNLNGFIELLSVAEAGKYHPSIVSYSEQLRFWVRGFKLGLTPQTDRNTYYEIYDTLFQHFVNMSIDLKGELIEIDQEFIKKGLTYLKEMKVIYGE